MVSLYIDELEVSFWAFEASYFRKKGGVNVVATLVAAMLVDPPDAVGPCAWFWIIENENRLPEAAIPGIIEIVAAGQNNKTT
ncbi:MAG: hypothetical protein LAO19_02335 [Acidobacteriia bacterium]|nr:hypothetical protein [Terriglobia bacterium]